MSGNKPDCVKCGWKPIIPENYEVMEIIFTYLNLMVDGMGGITSLGIEKVLEWNNIVDKDEKRTMIQKVILYLSIYLNTRHEEM